MCSLHFLIIAVLGAVSAQFLSECPANLARDRFLQVYGSYCYEFVISRKLEFLEAQLDCQSRGGSLASIASQDIQSFLFWQMQGTYKYDFILSPDLWIGLHDEAVETVYTWVDGTPLVYSNWANGEGGIDDDEDCVAINTGTGLWKDQACTSGKVLIIFNTHKADHGFICQYRIHAPATAAPATLAPITAPPPTTTTSTTTTTTPYDGHITPCPPFHCDYDCGATGFKLNPETRCSVCQCAE